MLVFFAASLAEAEPGALKLDSSTVALWTLAERGSVDFVFSDAGPQRIDLKPSSLSGLNWADGKNGRVLSFPGGVLLNPVDSRPVIELATNQVTVEAWVRVAPSAAGQPMGIIQYARHSLAGFRLTLEKDGEVSWLIQNGVSEVRLSSIKRVKPGQWTHLAATYDGESMRIYFNGVEDVGQFEKGGVVQPEDNDTLTIGYIGSGSRPYFVGEIDGLRISNRARTAF